MKNIVQHYRTLPAEMKAFLTVANKEVGLGSTLEVLAYLAGHPSNIPPAEREALLLLAKARNVHLGLEMQSGS